jgi:hypothetical protein
LPNIKVPALLIAESTLFNWIFDPALSPTWAVIIPVEASKVQPLSAFKVPFPKAVVILLSASFAIVGEVPEVPEEPEEPFAPEVPEEPEEPFAPEVPEEPEEPFAPEVPEEPEEPSAPEVPDVPACPASANEADTSENPGIDNVLVIPRLPVIWEFSRAISPFLAINSFAILFLFHCPKVRV